MKKKSPAFYRYCQDMASDHLSYYEPEEIEAAVLDLLDMNMFEDAEYLAEQGMRQHPNDDTMEKMVIWIYLHNHKAEQAEAMFQKYRNENSDWSIRMSFCFAAMHGHPQRALDSFVNALRDGQIAPLDWINTIDEMFEVLPMDVLSPYLVQVIEIIDKDAETLARVGTMLIDALRFEEAAKAIEKSLDLDAYDIYSWQDLSRCYLLMQNISKCQEACEYGLTIDETNPLLSFIMGYIHYERHEFRECIPYLCNARKFAEGQIDARNLNMKEDEIRHQIDVTYEMLGLSYIETEQYDLAKECFEIMSERSPKNPMSWLHLSSIYLYEGDLNKANDLIEHAIQLDPKNESARSLQVSILTTMHKFPEALSALKEILRLKPKSQSYLVAYATLASHSGLDKEADAAYRKLLKMGAKSKAYHPMLLDYFRSIGDDDAVRQLSES